MDAESKDGDREAPLRGAVRRQVSLQCVATEQEGYRLVGQRTLDLSPWGMRLSSRVPLRNGQRVRVTFEAPGTRRRWMQAEAVVARIEHGRRRTDCGYAVGLRFTDLPPADRAALVRRLQGMTPVIPRRPIRVAPSQTRPD